ncbi:polymorphic toxin type 50 domain-containing protein [Kribbella sp. VKM Ac-2571]|uniref:polymorphic toxin type 50 domain-containing protein n=1 Tax=Kribbella sp. VKM Ac-2571 TaxID=2512222 RepID=UPI0035157C61
MSKHFPGHPNYLPGRSQLTANPEELVQYAGTGKQVGSVPRGQPGFKERIDFGYRIGITMSREGVGSPTTVGILHYRADGSVHIVPGRP